MNIEELRNLCKKLPGVNEDIKWGNDLCFLIGEKMFCVTCLEPPFRASFKSNEKDFAELTLREGIIPAPYLARSKWVQVLKEDTLSTREWEQYVKESYSLIKAKLPKSILKKLTAL